MKQPSVHISEVKAYLNCILSWFWTAPRPRGLYLEPKTPRAALNTGRLTHHALHRMYDFGEDPVAAYEVSAAESTEQLKRERGHLFEEEFAKIAKDNAMMLAILGSYKTWAAAADQHVRFLATEIPWKAKLGRYTLEGRYDALVERPDGMWVLDFKTTSFDATDWTASDLQATAYVAAARKLYGPEVRGIIFRFIRKKAPKTYDELILKDGSVTRRKTIAKETTYQEYSLALAVCALSDIARMGEFLELDICDHAELLADEDRKTKPWYEAFKEQYELAKRFYYDELQALRGSRYFFWEVEEYRTEEQVENYFKFVIRPAMREMTSFRKGKWVGPTGLGAAWALCRNCSFKDPCRAAMAGADFKSMLREDYQVRKADHYG